MSTMDLGLEALIGDAHHGTAAATAAVGLVAACVGLAISAEIEAKIATMGALAAGAEPPLECLGTGMTGNVFRDQKGLAYKVPRTATAAKAIAEEAAWLETAAHIPYVKDHVVRFVRYDKPTGVLIREAVEGKQTGYPGKRDRPDRFTLHRTIAQLMAPYGFLSPEFKDESYRMVRGRGWVCFDAGFAPRVGRRLLEEVPTAQEGWEAQDLAFAISMESGKTIPKDIARRALVKLVKRSEAARKYMEGSLEGKEILREAGV